MCVHRAVRSRSAKTIAAPGTGTSGSIEPSPGGDGKSVLVFAPLLKDLKVT